MSAAAKSEAAKNSPPGTTTSALVPTMGGITRDCAGMGAVREDALRNRLGVTTYLLWRVVADKKLRDQHTGVCRMTYDQLGQAGGIEREMVKDCLARLRIAGLIDREHWITYEHRGEKRYVRVRRFRGSLPVVAGGVMAVPVETERFVAAGGRGGARPGAGRPRTWESDAARLRARRAAKRAEKSRQATGNQSTPDRNSHHPRPEFTSPPPFSSSSFSLCFLASPSENPNPRPSTAGLSLRLEEESETAVQSPVATPSKERVYVERSNVDPSQELPGVGDSLDGKGVATKEWRGPHPATLSINSLVPKELWNPHPIQVPQPRLFDAREDVERQVSLLARWYTSCVQERTGKLCFALRREPKRTRWYGLLKNAVRLCIKHGIAPAAWVAFSIDTWREIHGDEQMPSPSWVFSSKRLDDEKVRGWFRSVSTDYSGGRLVFTDKLRSFVIDQQKMRAAIDREYPENEKDLRAVVSRFFPGDSYNEQLEELKQESITLSDALKVRAEVGEWVW